MEAAPWAFGIRCRMGTNRTMRQGAINKTNMIKGVVIMMIRNLSQRLPTSGEDGERRIGPMDQTRLSWLNKLSIMGTPRTGR
jgi:hypothetical protein